MHSSQITKHEFLKKLGTVSRAKIMQVIDSAACAKIAADFKARASREGAAFPGVLLDYDHCSLDTEKPSEVS